MEGLVQTSLNPGILATKEDEISLTFSVRSSVASEKEELYERLVCLTESLGGKVNRSSDYPAWEYVEDSKPVSYTHLDVYKRQKLEALRNENATLVPGGKLEKDAFLTNKDGRKIGVIIRNLSDKNQKVSDCIVTKLSFSKEMFDGQITLPGSLGFNSTEKELKAAGFKKDADGIYTYTSKKDVYKRQEYICSYIGGVR